MTEPNREPRKRPWEKPAAPPPPPTPTAQTAWTPLLVIGVPVLLLILYEVFLA